VGCFALLGSALLGIAWHCLALLGIAWHCLALHCLALPFAIQSPHVVMPSACTPTTKSWTHNVYCRLNDDLALEKAEMSVMRDMAIVEREGLLAKLQTVEDTVRTRYGWYCLDARILHKYCA
jgi:hypothetical protein